MSALGPPSVRPTQPSIPPESANGPEVKTIKRQTKAAYVCLVAGQSPWARV